MAFSFFNRHKNNAEINQVVEVPMAAIVPNRYQPRKTFDRTKIAELAATIEEHGLLQPIVLREYEPQKYEIIAGERRFRAVETLNWGKIPAIVEKMGDQETAAMALIENLQREQLNAIEEAIAYRSLLEVDNLTQNSLAKRMGKSQSFIANKLRLLKLSETVQEAIMNGEITERHGRELLRLDDVQQQIALHRILANHLNVKETNQLVSQLLSGDASPINHQTSKQSRQKHYDSDEALQMVKKTVRTIRESGLRIKIHEDDHQHDYQLIIEIPKKGSLNDKKEK